MTDERPCYQLYFNTACETLKKCDIHRIDDRTHIYFLLMHGIVVYIGQTQNIKQRFKQHRRDKVFNDHATFIVDNNMANRCEEVLMQAFKPIYNMQNNHRPLNEYDCDFLKALGFNFRETILALGA